ncbi:unnamed protein product [Urochloa humidicola]
MDPFSKKHKSDENGDATTSSIGRAAALGLTCDDVLRHLKPLSWHMLAHIAATSSSSRRTRSTPTGTWHSTSSCVGVVDLGTLPGDPLPHRGRSSARRLPSRR